MRVREALNARDVAVNRLADACASVQEKSKAVHELQQEKAELQRLLDICNKKRAEAIDDKENGPCKCQEDAISEDEMYAEGKNELKATMKKVEDQLAAVRVSDPAGGGETDDNKYKVSNRCSAITTMSSSSITKLLNDCSSATTPLRDVANVYALPPLSSPFTMPLTPAIDQPDSPWTPIDGERTTLPTLSTTEKINARYAVLASLPLPSGIPEDSLTPILIPSPHSIHEFIATTSGVVDVAHFGRLGNYRVFQQSTTTWCPEREEHGYYLTPVFKCSTNPRVNTAHRWSAADIASRFDIPTECFYNKDGKWYYAGIYKSFRLDDLCPQEWECLSTETSQALIKETLAARKNTSPQNIYEVSQLYSAGALRVACIGVQCIGFNNALYRDVLQHAVLCSQSGKWRGSTGTFSPGLGLTPGSAGGGTVWNSPTTSCVPPGSGPGSNGRGIIGLAPGVAQSPQTPTVRVTQQGSQDSQTTFGGRPA
ncbi:uncharacterized protein BXZ73DRAFT_92797 [Epithele typhae]|uniref:uncharacterized protein n=1 Tax=Epithele typhae TaxID=378194 RepID=UPI0020081551|nr:uncharacterized protein BXZ73DRAFT_92797 [Epithele typhae]KAH9914513.1 hypothetical protein BXZ73DRAFT_92797 [Epithele typhae]